MKSQCPDYDVPPYAEFKTAALIEIAKTHEECWAHLQEPSTNSCAYDKEFLIAIMACHFKDYLDVLVADAYEKRVVPVNADVQVDDYGVTEQMLDELNKRPFKSKK